MDFTAAAEVPGAVAPQAAAVPGPLAPATAARARGLEIDVALRGLDDSALQKMTSDFVRVGGWGLLNSALDARGPHFTSVV